MPHCFLDAENRTFTSQYFSLELIPLSDELKIIMRMKIPLFHTYAIPLTTKILEEHLPSCFLAKCFNEHNISFKQEVRNTEIGHLFEHIMLEYLCLEKIKLGSNQALFNGITSWNWREDPKGTFYIRLDVGSHENDIVLNALEKSIQLMHQVLASASVEAKTNIFSKTRQSHEFKQ